MKDFSNDIRKYYPKNQEEEVVYDMIPK